MIEVEKKYIVHGEEWKEYITSKEEIVQSYFVEDDIRKRIRIINDGLAIITVKGETKILDGFLLRTEDEHTVSIEKGRTLLNEKHIQKTRYYLNVGVTILNEFYPLSVDTFKNLESDLVMAELEIPYNKLSYLSDKELAKLPTWLQDVTTNKEHLNYSNMHLIKKLKI